jgi:uncharacterized protein (DUF362 family)
VSGYYGMSQNQTCDSEKTLEKVSRVAFASQTGEAKDKEIYNMIDDVICQTFGPNGLGEIIKPGDKVIIKVNFVSPNSGLRGEKGRAIITDPRIVRYVAEKVRSIIGFVGTADLKVVDGTFYTDPNPSLKSAKSSFYWGRLERTGDNVVNKKDFCYDYNADGILDGTSMAKLVNLDSIGESGRQLYNIKLSDGTEVNVAFPKIFRKKEQANGSDEYCDVLIGLPIFKNHGLLGITGAIKLHYGIRSMFGMLGDTGRLGHDGLYYDENGVTHNKKKLIDYLCAQQLVRSYDFVIMDCLTANRQGPILPQGSVSSVPDPDMTADYILTNAIMASRDIVAIDTVETAFAGYKQQSIGILQEAAANKLGINDPGHIVVEGITAFSTHRKKIYDQYAPLGKYPLSTNGGAMLLDSIDAPFFVGVGEFTPDKLDKNLRYLWYNIESTKSNIKLSISRVELTVNGTVVEYKTGDELLSGQFKFDPSKVNFFNGAYLVCIVNAWDNIFNCVRSIEVFIKP